MSALVSLAIDWFSSTGRHRVTVRMLPIGIAGLLVLLSGCSKLTFENFKRVEPGMNEAEVESILGEPTFPPNDYTWVYSDDDRGITAMIYFKGDTVTETKWADIEHGMVGGSPDGIRPGDSETIRARKVE